MIHLLKISTNHVLSLEFSDFQTSNLPNCRAKSAKKSSFSLKFHAILFLSNRNFLIYVNILCADHFKFKFWVNFLGLVSRMDFILHILILLNCLNDLAIISLILDHSKVVEMHFWMIQSAKKEVFGGFLGFGLLDRVGIAYCVSS